MLNTRSQFRVVGSAKTPRVIPGNPVQSRVLGALAPRSAETASIVSPMMGGGVNNNLSINTLPAGSVLYDTMLSGLVGDNEKSNYRFYRDIYAYDTTAGSAVDLMATMPFSPFQLDGCSEPKRVEVYKAAIEALNFKTLLPEISVDRMVMGSCTMTPIYRASEKRFVDMISWQAENTTVMPTPFLGIDPLITIRPDEVMRAFLTSESEYFQKLRNNLSQDILESLHSSAIELDPLSTIFLPRKSFTFNHLGTSYFRRILPLYLLEKALYRGTLIEAGRRQRAMLHLQAGDDLWEPTSEEIQALVALFQQADFDPLGAIVGTRSSVNPTELRCLSEHAPVDVEGKGVVAISSLVPEGFVADGQPQSFPTPGLKVRGVGNEYREVASLQYQGERQVSMHHFSNEAHLPATDNHCVLVLRRGTAKCVLKTVGSLRPAGEVELIGVDGIKVDEGDSVVVHGDTISMDELRNLVNCRALGVEQVMMFQGKDERVFRADTAQVFAYRSLMDSKKARAHIPSLKSGAELPGVWDLLTKLLAKTGNSAMWVLENGMTFAKYMGRVGHPWVCSTYDLTMKTSHEPFFMVDGSILTKNSGGDFWKYTDITDLTLPMKMRGLGISESFLSQEACLTGDTLIATEHGLVPIEKLGSGKVKNQVKPLNITVDSRYGHAKTKAWIYNGYRDVYRVETETGNHIKATNNHPVLIFNSDTGMTEWKRVDKLQLGDIMCISQRKTVRESRLLLGVPKPTPRTLANGSKKLRGYKPFDAHDIKVPKYMTTDLAQWLALFISEGYTIGGSDYTCGLKDTGSGVGFSNSDIKLVERFVDLTYKLFGLRLGIGTKTADSICEDTECTGRTSFMPNHDTFYTGVKNRRLVDWLAGIGVWVRNSKFDGQLPSHHKQVPWSILQADEASQVAFLAVYADCDGSIRQKRTSWLSVSPKLLDGIHAMLNSHGYAGVTRGLRALTLHCEDSAAFWSKGEKYLSSKAPAGLGSVYSKLDGLPSQYWANLLKARKIKHNRHGAEYKDTEGNIVVWSSNEKPLFKRRTIPARFNYTAWKQGEYDNFLTLLGLIDKKALQLLLTALGDNHRYTPVRAIEHLGKDHVYDISMRDGAEPAFVANGLIVHNSYAAMDVSLSVFTENLRTYRTDIQQRIFYGKLFPLIAYLNDFFTKDMSKQQEKYYKETSALGEIKLKHQLNNATMLDMPVIHWEKALRPEVDQAHLETLATLKNNNVPVGIATWAAAGGMSTDDLLKEVRANEELKKKISEITGKPADEGSEEFARVRAVVQPGPRGLLSRGEFQHEYVTTSRTGKKKAVLNQKAARDQVYSQLEGLIKERAANPQHHYNMVKAVKARGGIPDIIGATSGPTL